MFGSQSARRTRVAAIAACLAAFVIFGGVVPAGADPGDIGYQGPHFSGTGTAPTGAKPESKLWWNDGSWWAVMWDEVLGDNYIYKLDGATQTWATTGVEVDNRSGTRADVIWDGTKLFVASHPYANHAQQTTVGARLYRFSYDPTTDRYTLDSGYPARINDWRTESLVIAKDSTGRIWATWNQGTQIMVNRSLTSPSSWGTPFTLPASGATGITTDDISSIVSFGNNVGIMWSDQTRAEFGFAVHRDGTGVTTWTKEVALSGPLMADDHINLKADGAGRVYAAVKTSKTASNEPLNYLLVRPAAGGAWGQHVFGLVHEHHTRPIVVLDQTHDLVHVFATAPETGGSIYLKTVEAENIAFPPGLGTEFIRDADSPDVNDPTSTKQSVTATSDLVVQASDDSSNFYWHNVLESTPLPLEANLAGTPTSGGVPLAVSFTDLSSGDPTSWNWDFGDGTTSTLENPSHTYEAPGTYSVRLRVSNAAGGTGEKTLVDYITVQPLVASFSGTPTTGAAPLNVAFTDTSTGDPTAWSWNFGDGNTSTLRNPTHTFAAPGSYSVSLTITGKNGATNTMTRTSYIEALPLTAEFTGTPLAGPAPHAVTFTDSSYGVPTSWEWSFGDGGTSTDQNPTHTYVAPGKYTVSLTVRDASGATSTKTRTDYVDVLPLTADFTATPTFGAVPLAVTFSDTSIGTPTTWAWDFGDGTTSSVEAPSHTYIEAGTYTVTLTVTDAAGQTSTKTRTDLVTVSPDAVFAATADSFVDSSQASRNYGASGSVRVRSGDSSPPHYIAYIKFDVAGLGAKVAAAKLRLYVTDPALDGGEIYLVGNDWTERGITYSNAPAVGGSALGALGVVELGTSVEVELPKSTFAAGNGAYSFAIKSNKNGGAAWYSSREGAVAPQLVLRLTPLPLNAEFSASPTSGGAPLTVGFSDASDGEPTTWSWDFGDGTTSTEQNPTHTYTEVGSYDVTLTVGDGDGTSTLTLTSFVTVEPLDAAFSATPTTGPAPLAVAFTDASLGDPVAWAWDFGDGTTSTLPSPTHTYTLPGTYTVTLTVTDVHGATSTETRVDYVTALPLTADFTASPTLGTAPLSVSYTDTSIGTPTTWSWSFGDGGTSTERNPTYTYLSPGVYTVTLTVTDAIEQTSTKTRTDYITASSDLVLAPVADSFVDSSQATRNYGTSGSVRVRNGDTSPPHYVAYIKFSVSGLAGPVTAAKLRLYVTDPSTDGGSLYTVDNGWTESGLTWNNAPVVGGTALAALGVVNLGTWIEVELPASTFAAGNGSYSFAIKSSNPAGGAAWYSSREGVAPAQLILR